METWNARLEQCRRADRFRHKIYLIPSYGLKVINYLRKAYVAISNYFEIFKLLRKINKYHIWNQHIFLIKIHILQVTFEFFILKCFILEKGQTGKLFHV